MHRAERLHVHADRIDEINETFANRSIIVHHEHNWIGARHNTRERLVDLVGDGGCQLAHHSDSANQLQFCPRLLKGRLSALALSDVDHGAHKFNEMAGRAQNRMTHDVNVPDGATRMHDAIVRLPLCVLADSHHAYQRTASTPFRSTWCRLPSFVLLAAARGEQRVLRPDAAELMISMKLSWADRSSPTTDTRWVSAAHAGQTQARF